MPRLKPRGVWVADVLDPRGNPVLFSVGSNGRCLEWIPWIEGQGFDEIVEQLWKRLDLADPVGVHLIR